MSAPPGRSIAQGDVLWTPPPDARERFVIGRYLTWLERERGLSFAGYDDLWQWSVTDLEGFWSSVWEFFEVRSHAPYERVLGSREMPGAEWFPGARLNFAEHMVGRDEDVDASAVVAYSQTRGRQELTFGDLREQVARARAGLQRLGVGPGDRVVAYLPNIPETLVGFLATASLGAIWATCPPEFGVRSVLDRLDDVRHVGDHAVARPDSGRAQRRCDAPRVLLELAPGGLCERTELRGVTHGDRPGVAVAEHVLGEVQARAGEPLRSRHLA